MQFSKETHSGNSAGSHIVLLNHPEQRSNMPQLCLLEIMTEAAVGRMAWTGEGTHLGVLIGLSSREHEWDIIDLKN